METKDKRVKREIANSNERRRMQSINAGFQKLKRLLPVSDGEKLSKANILQNAAEFIQQIERDKLILYEQNTLLRGILIEIKGGTDISTALETIDLDALPTIPINTHIAMLANNNAHNNSNDTTDNNSNDDSIRSVTIKEVVHKSANKNGNKEVNKNGNNNCETTAHINDRNSYHELATQPITGMAEIISDRVMSPKNGLVSIGVAKAAIALPLEVPYTSETAIRVDQHHHDLHPDAPPSAARKMLKTDSVAANTTIDPQDPAPKGQNLDTICKAIMEIEGDRVFKNENLKHEGT